ncbi:MAG: Phosphatidylinositol phosphate synthase @ Archaetidylinositol phosphate synthase, partial [uncultured Nocardioides sp.]
ARQVQAVLAGRHAGALHQPLPPARRQPRRGDAGGHRRGQCRRTDLLPAGPGVAGRAGDHRLRVQRPHRRGHGPQDGSQGRLRGLPGLDARQGRRRRPLRRPGALLRLAGREPSLPGPVPGHPGDGGGDVLRPGQGRRPRLRRQGGHRRAPRPTRRHARPGLLRRRARPPGPAPRRALGTGGRGHRDRRPADLGRTPPSAGACRRTSL